MVKTARSKPKYGILPVSRTSYPFIPCRTSSLRRNSRCPSSDSTTSMTTAPDEIPEQIKVPKRSRANTHPSNRGREEDGETVGCIKGSDEVIFPLSLLSSM